MIENVLQHIRTGRPAAAGLELFSYLLLTSTFERSLQDFDPAALARFARAAFAHLERRPSGRPVIGIRRTTELTAPDGSAGGLDLIEILNDDMPFAVESVMAELHSRGRIPRFVFHPIFKVDRTAAGELQAVVGEGDTNWAAGDQESYIAILLDPIEDEDRRDLIGAIDAVLDDVRRAARDAAAMRGFIDQVIASYEGIAATVAGKVATARDLAEAVAFLRWLGEGNFTLLGIRDYELADTDSGMRPRPLATGALGISRGSDRAPDHARSPGVTAAIQAIGSTSPPLVLSKSTTPSRVRRRVPLDRISIKRYSPQGEPVGELELLGLFTPASYLQPVEDVPLVRHKVRRVLEEARFPPDSHSGRTLVDILENFPRDELFQIEQDRLLDWSMTLLDLSLRPRARLLIRRDELGGYYSALVFVPRDHYSSGTRERIGEFLAQRLGGRASAYYPYITSGPLVRTQIIIDCREATGGEGLSAADAEQDLERGVVRLLETWQERLALAVARQVPAERVFTVNAAYKHAFSVGYTETFPVERAVEDIARIERLGPERTVAIDFYREEGAPANRVHAAIYRYDAPIPLSERVPLFENMGLRSIDERTYRIHPALDGVVRDVVLHDMLLESVDGSPLDLTLHDARMEAVFLAVFQGEAENDLFNALVIAAGMDWREAAVMRALAAFMRQMRAPFGPRYVAETLARHPLIARDLHELFRVRFDASGSATREERESSASSVRQRIETALTLVQGLDEDRVLRRLVNIVNAIVRTNVFQRDGNGQPPATIAFKLASREIDRLPEPKPYREIFVYSPRVEGVHLRFAPIARGGIRWSDRPQDFRTEILNLAKAQQVKNTVIVPSGAKGGFVPKQSRRTATREEVQAEGIACYRTFISALLSLTDNIRDGRIVSPAGVVTYDQDDPYLVVAADKGTATFSDFANEIALESGFWLGDAFASGGSAGYDHKRLGITARGAWECVKRHFREIDFDIQTTRFTVVGVGDMSGDVFGNAMLLSPAIALVAAFDHRDIFIDPTPDIAAGLAERKRLFALPRSSWADYDRTLISKGGGVFSRSVKSIPLTPEIKALLGVEAEALPPAELIQAVLRCEVDLLWFGGIGTFVRESQETDEQAGDRGNDALRVAASELKAKVIGEGANLGLTQRARIEAARLGIRLNTDFIDNSAGVNTSDQEVNIKIALEPALSSGRMTREDRNRLLAGMAPEVASAVLINNHSQGLALSLAERTSQRDIAHLSRLTKELETRGLIDRKLEALPSGAEFTARATSGAGMTRPELAVLLSWAKIALNADLLASHAPDDPKAVVLLLDYFPQALREGHREALLAHRLRREIIATRMTNAIINVGGPAVMARLNAETGREWAELVQTFLAVWDLLGIGQMWAALDRLDGKLPGGLQLELYQTLQELGITETARALEHQSGRSLAELMAVYAPAARELAAIASHELPPTRQKAMASETARLKAAGVPGELAVRLAGLDVMRQTIAVADRAAATGASSREAARAVLAVEDQLCLRELRGRIANMQAADEYERQVISTAGAAIETAGISAVDAMLRDPTGRQIPVDAWAAEHAAWLLAAKLLIDKVLAEPGLSISRLVAVADEMRGATRLPARER